MKQPLLKYCGNHTFLDYQCTVNSRATFIGLIFYKGSKRYIEPQVVSNWLARYTKKPSQELVGVFVNPSLEEVKQVLNQLPLDVIQLHGNESVDFLRTLKHQAKRPIWKAIHHGEHALSLMKGFNGVVDGFVVDVKTKHEWGGTGQSFNWEAVPIYSSEASEQGVPCFIAGGVKPDNISMLLRYHPQGIDLASGLEEDGVKSKQLIDELEGKVVDNYGTTTT